ncbi:MAG: DUF835 domain-containing protein [Candidatus Hadarchaeota archaeon]
MALVHLPPMARFFMPMPEDRIKKKAKYNLGEKYLVVESSPKLSVEIFKEITTHGVPGIWLTSHDPKSVELGFGLSKTAILSLTDKKLPGEATLPPDRLDRAVDIVANYLSRTGLAVALIDNFSDLARVNGISKVLDFIKKMEDTCAKNDYALIVVLDPAAFAEAQVNVLIEGFRDWRIFKQV